MAEKSSRQRAGIGLTFGMFHRTFKSAMSEPKIWKTLSSEEVYKNDRFKVRKDTCLLPDGNIVQDYFVLEGLDAAAVCAVTKSGEIVFVKQFRQGTGEITLELPGGVMSRHDLSIAETGRRELLEEAGYSSEQFIELATWYTDEPRGKQSVKFFLAPDADKVAPPKNEPHEYTDVVLLSIADAERALEEGQIKGALHAAGLYRALAELKKKKETA